MSKREAKASIIIAVILCCMMILFGCQSDSAKNDKTIASVPEREIVQMDRFLEVFKMFWQANMSGDYLQLRDSVTALVNAAGALANAELPAFYDDVKADFEAKIQPFSDAVVKFKAAAQTAGDSVMTAALDEVRIAFIDVMTAVSISLPELEHFHEVLQPLWHEALPNKDYAAIKAAIPDLNERAQAIVNAQLPAKYDFLAESFNANRNALKEAVNQLGTACESDSAQLIEEKMTGMHDAYHALTECLE
ncbi:MAG: hypothetical protein AB1746_05440 [Candidatus Zixiibacteriota bacterium]